MKEEIAAGKILAAVKLRELDYNHTVGAASATFDVSLMLNFSQYCNHWCISSHIAAKLFPTQQDVLEFEDASNGVKISW